MRSAGDFWTEENKTPAFNLLSEIDGRTVDQIVNIRLNVNLYR